MITFLVVNGIMVFLAVLLLIAENFLVAHQECNISINGQKNITVSGGNSLLSYLQENKLFIPSACGGKATCGFCKVKVLSGGGSILPTEDVYISKTERLEGTRLACQVKVSENLDILIPEHLLGAEEFEATAGTVLSLTHDIKLIEIKILGDKEINFKPGQYMQFKIPGTDEFRAYSIASSTSEKHKIELIVRQVSHGLCSTYIHKVLEPRDKITFTGPFGDFYLQEDSRKEIVAIAGGCGMAPIRSILYHLSQKGMPRKFTYFFGARSKKDLFLTEELRALEKEFKNFKYLPALSEPNPSDRWDGEVGLITEIVEKHVDSKSEKEAYLCGPPPMIDAAIKVLQKKGLKEGDIFYDKF